MQAGGFGQGLGVAVRRKKGFGAQLRVVGGCGRCSEGLWVGKGGSDEGGCERVWVWGAGMGSGAAGAGGRHKVRLAVWEAEDQAGPSAIC